MARNIFKLSWGSMERSGRCLGWRVVSPRGTEPFCGAELGPCCHGSRPGRLPACCLSRAEEGISKSQRGLGSLYPISRQRDCASAR